LQPALPLSRLPSNCSDVGRSAATATPPIDTKVQLDPANVSGGKILPPQPFSVLPSAMTRTVSAKRRSLIPSLHGAVLITTDSRSLT